MQRFANRAALLPLPSPRAGRPPLASWGLWAALASLAAVHSAGCVSTDRPAGYAGHVDAQVDGGGTDTGAADMGVGPSCEPGSNCDDGDPCTQDDLCREDGSCAGTPMVCHDTNPCTVDACALIGGQAQCVYAPQPGETCEDGDPCTTDDACGGDGTCAGTPKACDDDNPCTLDSCIPNTGGCQHDPAPLEGTSCDDGKPCTTDDACDASGGCVGTPKACDDELGCSTDSCDADTGSCIYDLSGCACVSDLGCDDHNPCTTDACDLDTGTCTTTPLSSAEDAALTCDDGDACTTDDACVDGACAGTPKTCDDGVACTVDTCDAETGTCLHDGAACECSVDGDCATGDPCGAATCDDNRMCAISPELSDGAACTTDQGVSGACTEATCGGVVQVASGFHHTCALTAAGKVRCWGFNDHGQLGAGHTDDLLDGKYKEGETYETASLVDFGAGETAHPVALALGGPFSCAVMSSGDVRCWGANDQAQLGAGYPDGRMAIGGQVPTTVAPLQARTCLSTTCEDPSWVADPARTSGPGDIAAGEAFACVLGQSGHVHCWGANGDGQTMAWWPLGAGIVVNPGLITDEDNEPPSDLWIESHATGFEGTIIEFTKIVAGRGHACVLSNQGFAYCWGSNGHGQLGQGHQATVGDNALEFPMLVSFSPDHIVDIAAGGEHTCAALASGLVRCWGRNGQGQLGAGHTEDLMDGPGESPSVVSFLPHHAIKVACGGAHSCALLDDGTVRCWGQNDFGQLGAEHTNDLMDEPGESPSTVDLGGETAVALTAGQTHTCALLASQQVVCWGRGLNGRLGTDATLRVGDAANTMPPKCNANAMGAAGSCCHEGEQCLLGTCTNGACD